MFLLTTKLLPKCNGNKFRWSDKSSSYVSRHEVDSERDNNKFPLNGIIIFRNICEIIILFHQISDVDLAFVYLQMPVHIDENLFEVQDVKVIVAYSSETDAI